MSTQQQETGHLSPEITQQARKSYQPPNLVTYGLVRQLTQNGNGSGNDGTNAPGMTMKSDERLKTNIRKVGEHPDGFGLYLFVYKSEFQDCGAGRQFGVMAQEVELIIPEAVSIGENGYRQVNYALLGISQTKH